MKSRVHLSILVLTALFLITGTACEALGLSKPTLTPEPSNTPIPPTNTPNPPTNTPIPPTNTPSPTPIPTDPILFTEEFNQTFNGDPPLWSHFLTSGSESKLDIKSDGGSLILDLTGKQIYLYLTYDPYNYDNVRFDIRFENRGRNTNNVSLICQYSKDIGWYEFNIGNDGVWNILFYDIKLNRYRFLTNGGSMNIHPGQGTNEYAIVCKRNDLTLNINEVETSHFKDTIFSLQEGKVGFSVSSFDVLPIIIAVDWIKISQP
jgi:hypothetical protein